MKYSAPLFLASSSQTRQWLLSQAHIPFSTIRQVANEHECDWNQEPSLVASTITRIKMEHIELPEGSQRCFVLTADTVCVDSQGSIHGKPQDQADAIRMLKLFRAGSHVVTAFCLDKKQFVNGTWITENRIEEVVTAKVTFSIPDEWLEEYLHNTVAQECAGGMMIEGYGSQFVRSIEGSYSAILGLPLCELRIALTQMGFFIF